MANELLKMLTIDGQTMNILTPTAVYIMNTTAVSVARNTVATYDIWTAPKDGWLVGIGITTFAQDTTGYRFLDIYNSRSGAHGGARVAPPTNGQCQLTVTVAIPVQEGDVIQLRYSHGASGNLNVVRRAFHGIFYTKD